MMMSPTTWGTLPSTRRRSLQTAGFTSGRSATRSWSTGCEGAEVRDEEHCPLGLGDYCGLHQCTARARCSYRETECCGFPREADPERECRTPDSRSRRPGRDD